MGAKSLGWRYGLVRGLGITVCWLAVSWLMQIWLAPERQAVAGTPQLFFICVQQNGEPKMMPLQDWRQQPLCAQTLEWTHPHIAERHFQLRQQDDEWTLSSWGDDSFAVEYMHITRGDEWTLSSDIPADPLVFHYRTADKGGLMEITPLWTQQGGGLMADMLAFVFGLPLSLLISLPLLQVIRRRWKAAPAGSQAT